MGQFDDGIRSFRVDALNGLDQSHMRRQMNDPQVRGRQHHREILGIREISQNFGVTRIHMSALMQSFLVQRSRADGMDLPLLRQIDGSGQKLKSGISRDGRYLAECKVSRHEVQINDVYGAELVCCFGWLLNGVHLQA